MRHTFYYVLKGLDNETLPSDQLGPKVAKLQFRAIYQSSPCCKRITVVHLLDYI